MDDQQTKQVLDAFAAFIQTVAQLRHPTAGCPWDLKQNHETLRRFMIEEAYEASAAMACGDAVAIADELGDVLLQVVLNAQVGSDGGQFSLLNVIESINNKMLFRHPHVFAKELVEQQYGSSFDKSLRQQWDNLKAQEKKPTSATATESFAKAYGTFPSTIQANKIGRIAEKIDFDWKDSQEVFKQLKDEVTELENELTVATINKKEVAKELGDVFFTLAQLCRHLDLDPEVVAQDGNQKFLRRFANVEKLALDHGIDIKKASMAEKEILWQEAKSLEQANKK